MPVGNHEKSEAADANSGDGISEAARKGQLIIPRPSLVLLLLLMLLLSGNFEETGARACE